MTSPPLNSPPSSSLDGLQAKFNALNTPELLEKELLERFDLLEQLIGVSSGFGVQRDDEPMLVEALATFYEAHGRYENFLNWSIEHEIKTTDSPNELFRQESFATQLMFRAFFDDLGRRYINATVLPIIRKISEADPSELDLDGNTARARTNLKFLFECASTLMSDVAKHLSYLPIVLRKAFNLMEERVKEQYPDVESPVPTLLFLRFLCPTMVQPQKFGLLHDLPRPESFRALINLSKLLQNIANGIVKNNVTAADDEKGELIRTFIQSQIPVLRQFTKTLTDQTAIDDFKSQIVRHASLYNLHVKGEGAETAAEKTIKRARVHLFTVVKSAFLKPSKAMDEEDVSPRSTPRNQYSKQKFEAIQNKMSKERDGQDWKMVKMKHGFKVYSKRSSNRRIMLLSEGVVEASPQYVFDKLAEWQIERWTDQICGHLLTKGKSRMLGSFQDGSEDWYLRIAFPFPFGDRDVVINRSHHKMKDGQFAVYSFSVKRPDVPTVSGVIRASMDVAMFFRPYRNDSARCHWSNVVYLNPRGVLPQWTLALAARNLLSVVLRAYSELTSPGHPAPYSGGPPLLPRSPLSKLKLFGTSPQKPSSKRGSDQLARGSSHPDSLGGRRYTISTEASPMLDFSDEFIDSPRSKSPMPGAGQSHPRLLSESDEDKPSAPHRSEPTSIPRSSTLTALNRFASKGSRRHDSQPLSSFLNEAAESSESPPILSPRSRASSSASESSSDSGSSTEVGSAATESSENHAGGGSSSPHARAPRSSSPRPTTLMKLPRQATAGSPRSSSSSRQASDGEEDSAHSSEDVLRAGRQTLVSPQKMRSADDPKPEVRPTKVHSRDRPHHRSSSRSSSRSSTPKSSRTTKRKKISHRKKRRNSDSSSSSDDSLPDLI